MTVRAAGPGELQQAYLGRLEKKVDYKPPLAITRQQIDILRYGQCRTQDSAGETRARAPQPVTRTSTAAAAAPYSESARVTSEFTESRHRFASAPSSQARRHWPRRAAQPPTGGGSGFRVKFKYCQLTSVELRRRSPSQQANLLTIPTWIKNIVKLRAAFQVMPNLRF